MIWFTADTHFDHHNILKASYRPFDSVEDMNEAIIGNWNKVVKPNDEVYHLGDFCWKTQVDRWAYFVGRLNGTISLIKGNHDAGRKQIAHLFKEVEWLKVLRYEKQRITLCHYAMRTWYCSHYGTYQLYGHSHGTSIPEGKQMDVGIDANNFFPISIEKVMSKMLLKPDNSVIDCHESSKRIGGSK